MLSNPIQIILFCFLYIDGKHIQPLLSSRYPSKAVITKVEIVFRPRRGESNVEAGSNRYDSNIV